MNFTKFDVFLETFSFIISFILLPFPISNNKLIKYCNKIFFNPYIYHKIKKEINIFNPDIICEKNFFSSIQKYLDGKLDFSIIGTSFAEQSDYHTAGFFDNKKNLKEANFLNEFNLYDVDWVSGCSLLLNLNNFDDEKIFDENFFLFFEEFDLCKSLKRENKNVFSCAQFQSFFVKSSGVIVLYACTFLQNILILILKSITFVYSFTVTLENIFCVF